MGAPTRLRVRGPADMIPLVPYLLGFTPTDSLVVCGLQDGSLLGTARVDLAGMTPDTVRAVAGMLARGGATHAIAFVYSACDAGARLPHRDLIDALRDSPAPVSDAVHVHGRSFSSYGSPDGCRTEQPVPDAPAAEVVAVYAGMAPLTDRAALEQLFAPAADTLRRPDLAEAEANLPENPGALDRVQRELFAAADAGRRLSDEQVARFGALLARDEQRDAVWLAVESGRLADARGVWLDLATRLPGVYRAAPLLLHGWTSWRHGDGARAAIAAAAALDADPRYEAAQVLGLVLRGGVNGRAVPRVPAEEPYAS